MAKKDKTASADKNADASQEKLESMENLTPSTPENSEDENLALIKELESENLKLQSELKALKETADSDSMSVEELADLVSEKETELALLTKILNARHREAEKEALILAEKDDKRPVFKDDRGLSFRFKKSAPKTLNIDGKATKLEDIIKDKEVMSELIYGNSNFVEQKHL